MKIIFSLFLLVNAPVFSNPYPDPKQVPKDPPYVAKTSSFQKVSAAVLREKGVEIIRVDISYLAASESYTVDRVAIEQSGTEALVKRASRTPAFGSYKGVLKDSETGESLFYDSVGTGMEMRLLTRGITFRFPKLSKTVDFVFTAENPKTGVMETVLTEKIDPNTLNAVPALNPEVRILKQTTASSFLKLNIYSEGYVPEKGGTAEIFFKDAGRIVDALQRNSFPGLDKFEIAAVYSPSRTQLGKAKNLGLPVPERDSFLGLYYPYWDDFGRWYNIVYPTREKKFRDNVGVIPYDYALALIDSGEYWGIGNFNLFTAIPSRHPSFTYLLLHEFGHFFGLNEEYESGGKTELAFAPGIKEPWSQNITFHPKRNELKWVAFVDEDTNLPTPSASWHQNGPWGAYKGGYAQTEPLNKSHKPGLSCIMKSDSKFCPVCLDAIQKKIAFDLGE